MLNRKSKNRIFFLLGILCFSCNSGVKTVEGDKVVANEIVLIFRDCPPDINIFRWQSESGSFGFLGPRSDILFADSTLSVASTNIFLRKTPNSDTLTITNNTQYSMMVVHHRFNFEEFATYLFHNGDTVLFTYKGHIPYATVLNRETSFYESNYNVVIREKVRNSRMPALLLYSFLSHKALIDEGQRDRHIFRDMYMRYILEREQVLTKEHAIELAIEEVIREYQLQDSLHHVGLLSDYQHAFRRFLLIRQINHIYEQGLDQHSELTNLFTKTDLSEERFEKFHSLLRQSYYQHELNARVNKYLADIRPTVIDGRVSVAYFLARFDRINSLEFLSIRSKHSFFKDELRRIVEVGDRNNIEKYSQKFIAITGDTSFVNRLLADNNMGFCNSNHLLLVDRDNNQTNLQEVLDRNNGKVIYVSFWASWCAPCIASMPYAELLRKEYKDKDVVFVYLALNDDRERWKTAKQQVGLSDFAGSYFITNSRTAPMIADLNVRTLPRYLLFNRQGELVHRKAPGPQGTEIRELLNSLLREDLE